jgi:hypothetical protein
MKPLLDLMFGDKPRGLRWCGEREGHVAHDECDGWKADVPLSLALREHHRDLVRRGLQFCPRCGLRLEQRR